MPVIRIDDEAYNYFKMHLAEPLDDTPNTVVHKLIRMHKELTLNQNGLKNEQKFISTQYWNSRITGRKPKFLKYKGKSYPSKSWIEFYMKLCSLLAYDYNSNFSSILEIRGRKRAIFTKDANKIPYSYRKLIEGTDIYTNINDNPNRFRERIEKILEKLGLSKNIVDVELK